MDKISNPYTPNAGSEPPELAGRGELLERAEITLRRILIGNAEKNMIIAGLRGVGKTVLLNRFTILAEHLRCQTCVIEAEEDKPLGVKLATQLRSILLSLDRHEALADQVTRALRVLKGFIPKLKANVSERGLDLALDIEPELGVADSGILESDLPDLLQAVGEAAKSRDTAVVILIDEIRYLPEPELNALIMAMHRIAQKRLPVVMLGAGLPQVVALFGNLKSYSERLFAFPKAGPLTLSQTQDALMLPAKKHKVIWERDAIEKAHKITEGYAYFVREWSKHTWNCAPGPTITRKDVAAASKLAKIELDESFFPTRFDRLTPREQDCLGAMAALGPGVHDSGGIAKQMGVKVQTVAPLRASLIKKGMIYTPAMVKSPLPCRSSINICAGP